MRVLIKMDKIGVIDAALVRWLLQQRSSTNSLVVQVGESLLDPLIPMDHALSFLQALEPVDHAMNGATNSTGQNRVIDPITTRIIHPPETELWAYSLNRINKRSTITERAYTSSKLTTIENLREKYGARPHGRERFVGVVSGSFDLIHPGHVWFIEAAKKHVDVLVILTLSTTSIQNSQKNHDGDRPIFNERDRVAVLSALRPVDHLVVIEDSDCQSSLRAFCPDLFIKSEDDVNRPVVQTEAALVKKLDGRTLPHVPSSRLFFIVNYQFHPGEIREESKQY